MRLTNLPGLRQSNLLAKAIADWAPVAKTFATKSPTLFGALASVDSSQPFNQFTQTILAGKDPRTALTTFQTALQAIVK